MSWLSIPLPNPFKSLQSESSPPLPSSPSSSSPPSSDAAGGVKNDLSVIGQTISRQLRGVAAFLAPPPAAYGETTTGNSIGPPPVSLSGIRNDLVEISGSVKSGLSLISTNKAVSEISKLASNLLQIEEVEDEGDDGEAGISKESDDEHHSVSSDVLGINDEVLQFVNEISVRPECWTDFPLLLNYEFNFSNTQKEHVSTILGLSPSLTTLKNEHCSDISSSKFWMIYFLLLLPRLDAHCAELLSTPEILQARDALLQQQKKNHSEIEHKIPEKRPAHDDTGSETEDVSFSDLEDEGGEDQLSCKPSPAVPAPVEPHSSEDSSNEWLTIDDFESDGSKPRLHESCP